MCPRQHPSADRKGGLQDTRSNTAQAWTSACRSDLRPRSSALSQRLVFPDEVKSKGNLHAKDS